jgi:hypothetical protein
MSISFLYPRSHAMQTLIGVEKEIFAVGLQGTGRNGRTRLQESFCKPSPKGPFFFYLPSFIETSPRLSAHLVVDLT